MFLGKPRLRLVLKRIEEGGHPFPRFPGQDDFIDDAETGGKIGVVELRFVGGGQFRALGRRIVGARYLAPIDDVARPFGPHDGDFRGRPGHHIIGAQSLGAHRDVAAAVSLADDNGDFYDRGFGVGMEQFGAMPDDPGPFLLGAGHVAGEIRERQERDVEGVAEPDEPRGLVRGVHIEDAGAEARIVGDHADRPAHDPDEGHNHIFCPVFVGLEHFMVVGHGGNDLLHIVCARRLVRDHRVQLRALSVRAVRAGCDRLGAVTTVGKIGEHGLHAADALRIVFRDEMADPALGGMGHRTA